MIHWARASNLLEVGARRARPTGIHISCPIDMNEIFKNKNIAHWARAARVQPA